MADKLIQHLRKFVDIPEEARELVLSSFTSLKVKKKENILENGNICKCNYFVVSGCLRLFFINEKGVEQTTQFASENWWLSDYSSFQYQQPSIFFIQDVENS